MSSANLPRGWAGSSFAWSRSANRKARHVASLFSIPAIKSELNTVDMLLSPLDAQAQPFSEEMMTRFSQLNLLDEKGVSYSICHGGDQLSPGQ